MNMFIPRSTHDTWVNLPQLTITSWFITSVPSAMYCNLSSN